MKLIKNQQNVIISQTQRFKKVKDFFISLENKLGEGQFGSVYIAFKENEQYDDNKILYAVKVINTQNMSEEKKKQIFNEITILKTVNHDNLLKFVDYAITQANMYIFTQYCEGGTLQDYIKNQQNQIIYQSQACYIIQQIVNGYQELYDKKIVHRDLKPANIMISNGHIKIGDFGFGKLIQGNMDQQQFLSCKGSYLWAAPQIIEMDSYSSKCDLWSLGVIFYEMLYGCFPFIGQTTDELLLNIKYKTYHNPISLPMYPTISPQIKKIIQSLLRYKEEDRINFNDLVRLMNEIITVQNIQLQSSYSTVLLDNSIDQVSIEKLEMSIESNVKASKNSYVRQKLFQSKIMDEKITKTNDIELNFKIKKQKMQQINQLFIFMRQKAGFCIYSFQLLYNNCKSLEEENKIPLYYSILMMYCQILLYSNMIEEIHLALKQDDILKNGDQQMFTLQEIHEFQKTQEYKDFINVIQQDKTNAIELYDNFVFNASQMLNNISNEQNENLQKCLQLINQHHSFKECINWAQQWMISILKIINLQQLEKSKLATLYSIMILQELDKYFAFKTYLEFDISSFYGKNFDESNEENLILKIEEKIEI